MDITTAIEESKRVQNEMRDKVIKLMKERDAKKETLPPIYGRFLDRTHEKP